MPLLGPIYHFYNLQYSIPTSSAKDRVIMMYITKCIMDSGWEREKSRIKNHLLEVKINVIKCKYIGKAPSYRQGPSGNGSGGGYDNAELKTR